MVWPLSWPYAIKMQVEDVSAKKKTQEDEKKKAAEANVIYPWHMYGYPYITAAPFANNQQPYLPIMYNPALSYPIEPQSVYLPYSPSIPQDLSKEESKAKQNGHSKAQWHYVQPGQPVEYPNGWMDANGVTHYHWAGRTRAEVIGDDFHLAASSRVTVKHELAPKNAKPLDMFWVQEPSGESNLRNYAVIMDSMQGDWCRDPNYGHLYFKKSVTESTQGKEPTNANAGWD